MPAPAAATPLADRIRPTVPTRVRVVSRSGTYVTFAWRASTDNVGVTRYLVFRSGRSKPVASTTSPRVRIRTAYRAKYYVRAVDVAGNRSGVSVRVSGR